MKTKLLTLFLCFISFQISDAQWVQVSAGLDNRDVTSLVSGSNTIFAGTYNFGVYLSTDNDISWHQTSLNNRYIFSLVNENLSPGTYNVEFKGSELSSGVYFYKIQAGNFSAVKRMFLLK